MASTMTTAPTSQMIWFMVFLLRFRVPARGEMGWSVIWFRPVAGQSQRKPAKERMASTMTMAPTIQMMRFM